MPPRLIVAMPRGAAQVSLTVPAMYGLLAPLAAFSLAINMAVAFTVAHGMRLSGEVAQTEQYGAAHITVSAVAR